MKKINERNIQVYADWETLSEPTLIGTLYAIASRNKEVFSFAYDDDWLKMAPSHILDPSLQLFPGKQFAPPGQKNFGLFLDSSPDRWGRFLMDRREAQIAREENRSGRNLVESDYLLGVFDANRIGALRFRTSPNGPFLDDNTTYASPPWTSLSELEHASLSLEKKNAEKKSAYKKWLHMLIAPGGSLGGARPKASIVDPYKNLWIAKFPSAQDDHDIGAWEMVAFLLAKQSKIQMSEAKLKKFNSKCHTFLSKRFDRTGNRRRIHFASAMTLLQRSDGDDSLDGASYLELAEFLIKHGAQPKIDLEQLWRRIVFSMCISNVDDHLRNHGFLLQSQGWVLSPAFDINPVSYGNGLTLNVSETDNTQDIELAKEVAEYFLIKPKRAIAIIQEIISAVKNWHKEAKTIGLSRNEQEKMEEAFRLVK